MTRLLLAGLFVVIAGVLPEAIAQGAPRGLPFDVYIRLQNGMSEGELLLRAGKPDSESIENMRNLVYAFYDTNFSFAEMLKKYPEMRGKLTDCLIGDLDGKDYSDLFARVSEFAQLPEPLMHGRAPREAVPA